MDTVAELVEEGDDFVVFEEGWFGGCWFGEVAYQRCGWIATSTVGIEEAWLEVKVGGVTILSWTWV